MLKNNRVMGLAFVFASILALLTLLTYNSMSMAKLYDEIQGKGTRHELSTN